MLRLIDGTHKKSIKQVNDNYESAEAVYGMAA
jgi:hypothetical protein